MKKIVRLTESDLVSIVKRVVSEQKEVNSLTSLGFEKWGDGYLLRIPKSSSPKNDVIRIQVDQIGDKYNITILVQGNKRTRSEINGVGIFKEIERLLNSSFRRQDSIFDIIGGYGNIDTLKQIVNKLKSLNIDVKSNSFTQGTISEQTVQNNSEDWKGFANLLQKSMEGLGTDEESINTIIYNRINNKSDWDNLQKAFGVRNGENLIQWLKGDLSSTEYSQLINWVNNTIKNAKKEDLKYNVGSKIKLISNRQFIIARAYQYSDVMGDTEELELDINNATVVRRDKDGFVVKVPSVYYYAVSTRKSGSYPKQKTLNNPCIKIKFTDIIEWDGDSLQIRWFANSVENKVVTC